MAGLHADGYCALIAIFAPILKPDLLISPLTLADGPDVVKFRDILRNSFLLCSPYECNILRSAQQYFPNWFDLHCFAFDKKEQSTHAAALTHNYSTITGEAIDIANYLLDFNYIVDKYKPQIKAQVLQAGYSFQVHETYIRLISCTNSAFEWDENYINEASSFCKACIKEEFFGRALLQNWCIQDGFDFANSCIFLLRGYVECSPPNELEAFKVIPIVYCVLKMRDTITVANHFIRNKFAKPGNIQDNMSAQWTRASFSDCLVKLYRHANSSSGDKATTRSRFEPYISYVENCCTFDYKIDADAI